VQGLIIPANKYKDAGDSQGNGATPTATWKGEPGRRFILARPAPTEVLSRDKLSPHVACHG
jgi:hypothetical protein